MNTTGKGGAARASRSGRRLSYAERVELGQRRLEAWLPAETMVQLDEICEVSGYSRPEIVATMIEMDHATRKQSRKRRK